ncbi:hypothetical protein ACDY96_17390 [Rhizobium mongolense]|uniref:hypothetical protein n=1 Tax=Rhizobium mongolense TaxID=57676 RepID=UPI0035560032
MGLLSDFAIDVDELELLQAIITDACNKLKISPDHQGFVTRVVDLHSQGHSQKAILESLRVEFGKSLNRRTGGKTVDD